MPNLFKAQQWPNIASEGATQAILARRPVNGRDRPARSNGSPCTISSCTMEQVKTSHPTPINTTSAQPSTDFSTRYHPNQGNIQNIDDVWVAQDVPSVSKKIRDSCGRQLQWSEDERLITKNAFLKTIKTIIFPISKIWKKDLFTLICFGLFRWKKVN